MTDIIKKQFLFLFMGFSYCLISIHFKNKYTKETNVCQRQGRCGLGCIPGARHTLNKQIYEAINRGKPLDVHPLCEVIDTTETSNTEKDIDGHTYNVKFIDYRSVIDDPNVNSLKDLTDEEKEKLTKTIRTKMVIVSAGSLRSTEIPLRCKSLRLSKSLGSGFSTNGDMFGIINPTKEMVDASRGPIQTSIARFNDSKGNFVFSIEDVGIPKMFAEIFATISDIMKDQRGSMMEESYRPKNSVQEIFRQQIVDNITSNINNPQIRKTLFRLIESIDLSSLLKSINRLMEMTRFLSSISSRSSKSPQEPVYDKRGLFGIGLDEKKGQLVPKNGADGELDLKEEDKLDRPIFTNIIDKMRLFAKEMGKDGEDSLVIPMWGVKNKTQIVAHPLGGRNMGKDVNGGVLIAMVRYFGMTAQQIKRKFILNYT